MKWIGQHIWDFISRFRGDVYIENLSTTTETDVLVVDSDGKVSKNTIEDLHHDTSSQASVDNSGSTYIQDVTLDTYGHVTGLTSAAIPTLNQDTTGQAGTVATIAGLAPNTATTQAAQPNITSLGTLTNLQVDYINANASTLTITDSTDTGDLFSIATTTHGATTIATVDDDADAAHLTLNVDGNIILDSHEADNASSGIMLKNQGTEFARFTTHHSKSFMYLFDNDTTDDYLFIAVGEHGATTLQTKDSAAAAADLTFNADGDITLDAAGDITLNVDNNNDTTNNTVVFQDNGTVGFSYNVGRAAMDMQSNASPGYPYIQMDSTSDDAFGSALTFKKSRTDSSIQIGEVGDGLGKIEWKGYNDGTPALKTFAQIISTIADPVTGAEAGDLTIKVASYDGVLTDGLKLHGDTNADGEVDVTIGAGAASVTTIVGGTTLTKTATLLNNNPLAFNDLDNSHTVDLRGPVTQADNRAIALPDADGTVQLQGSNAGQTFSVPLKVDDLYVLYVSTQNVWYHTAYAGQNFGSAIGAESDSTAMRGVSYVAPAACKVNKVTIAFYSTGSADLEFQVTKIPLVDNSNSNVTLAAMTHNDINFSMVANYNYVKTMTMTGAGSDNALTAGQAFTLAIRRTDATGTRVLYGTCFAEIELT